MNISEHALERLQTSEIRYRRLFEAARDGVLILNAESLKITDVNPFMTELLGYSREEFLGRELWELGFFSDKEASKEAFLELQANGYLRYDDLPLKTRGGESRAVEFVSNVYDEGGTSVIQCNIRDITERKQLEAKAETIEEGYKKLFEFAPDGIIIASPESYYLDANPGMCKMLGYLHSELIGMHATDIVAASETKDLDAALSKVMTATEYSDEWCFKRKDGSRFIGDVIARIMPDGNLLAMVRDVTEQKQADDALRLAEGKYRSIFENSSDGIFQNTPEGQMISANPALARIYGYSTPEEMIREQTDIATQGYADPTGRENFRRDLEKYGFINNFEYEIRRKDGTSAWVSENTRLVRDASGASYYEGSMQDITERKRTENERRIVFEIMQGSITTPNLEEFLNLIHGSISKVVYAENCFVMLHDPETDMVRYEFWRDKYDPRPASKKGGEGFSGYVLRTGKPHLLTAESMKALIEAGEAKQIGKASPSWVGVPLFTPDRTIGVLVLQHYETKNVYDQHDLEFLSAVGVQVALAIERKRAQEALGDSEERYRSVVETAPDVIITIDETNTILFVNPAAESVFGYKLDEMRGTSLTMLMPEYLRHLHSAAIERYQITGVKHVGWEYVELTGLHKSGREVPITVSFSEFVQNGRRYFTGIIRDISEGKRAMEALQESEERYRDLFENAIDMIYTQDLEGNYTSINLAAEKITGYTREETLTRNMVDSIAPEQREKVVAQMKDAILFGKHATAFELEIIAKDGRRVAVEVNMRIVYENGVPVGVQGIARDVTERKQTQAALILSEERYRELVENALDIIYTHDLKGNYTSVNKAAETITGYTNAEILAMNMAETIPAGQVEKASQMIAAKLAGKTTTAYELELIAKDGHIITVEVNTRIIYQNGVPTGVQGIARDITERKRAEREIKLVPAIVSVGLVALVVLAAVEVIQDILTVTIGYWTGLSFTIIFGALAAAALTYFALKRQRTIHRRTLEEIAERKRTQSALEESEASFKSLFDTANDAIMVIRDGVFIDCNACAWTMFGCTKEWIIGRSPMNLSPPVQPDGRISKAPLYLAPALDGIPQFFEWQHLRMDGTLFDAEVSLNRVDVHGEMQVQAIVRDITERKRAEEELSEANQRAVREYEHLLTRVSTLAVALGSAADLQEIFRKLRDFAVFSTSMNGLFISFFDADRNMRTPAFAWSEGEEVDVSTLPAMEMNSAPHSRAVSTGEVIITDDFQSAIKGQPAINIGLDVNPILPQSSLVVPMAVMGRIIGAVEVQSTERAAFRPEHATALQMAANLAANAIENVRLLENERQQAEQLRQSQKMEAVGILAGGIAHDFNNLLTAINGYSDLTLKKLAADDPLRQNIQEVKNAGVRAAELTGQLLAFSRKQVLRTAVINLNTVVSNIENMLRRIIRESVELRVVLDPKLGNVKADQGQIEQVIMNLAINARDAMPDGGTLTVETRNIHLDEDYVSQHLAVTPGDFIRMTVTDTGVGMDAAVKQHIFEPFFTTKDVGKGTGLGLATVYGIVKQSGGDIMVYSEPGHGTTFKVYLPCVDESVQKRRWTGEHGPRYTGTETILLAEDEEIVRNLVREILTGNGYKVLEAASGRQAIAICGRHDGPIHMLLTDVIMPKMGGIELSEKVIKLIPEIKVLFMSGYTDDAVADRGLFNLDTAFIEKPFTPDALSSKVREVFEN